MCRQKDTTQTRSIYNNRREIMRQIKNFFTNYAEFEFNDIQLNEMSFE